MRCVPGMRTAGVLVQTERTTQETVKPRDSAYMAGEPLHRMRLYSRLVSPSRVLSFFQSDVQRFQGRVKLGALAEEGSGASF